MNDKLEALFKAMQGWGYVPADASFDEFASKHSDLAKQLELYNFLKQNGHTAIPAKEFIDSAFPVVEVVILGF